MIFNYFFIILPTGRPYTGRPYRAGGRTGGRTGGRPYRAALLGGPTGRPAFADKSEGCGNH